MISGISNYYAQHAIRNDDLWPASGRGCTKEETNGLGRVGNRGEGGGAWSMQIPFGGGGGNQIYKSIFELET